MSKYEERSNQKERVLNVLKSGKRITQINLRQYLALLRNGSYAVQTDVVDAIAELGVANLPARIFGLKKDGYDIKTKRIDVDGRFGKTYYYEYYLDEGNNV